MKKGLPASGKAKADKASVSADSAATSDAAAEPWLTCVRYEFQVARLVGDFQFRFSVYDKSGARHSLELDNKTDCPDLAQDLYDALQIWPEVNIKFKSKKVDGAAYPQITAIQRIHPRA